MLFYAFSLKRNDTLLKWDEKTRLTNVKIKSKNFAAFDLSVLKQIEQVFELCNFVEMGHYFSNSRYLIDIYHSYNFKYLL